MQMHILRGILILVFLLGQLAQTEGVNTANFKHRSKQEALNALSELSLYIKGHHHHHHHHDPSPPFFPPVPPVPPPAPEPPLPPPPPTCPTFADFAQQYGIPIYEATKQDIDNTLDVDEDSIIPATVHKARKALLKMRTFLDVFAPAYSSKNDDMFGQFRAMVDEGYETIGSFQDLDHMGEEYSFREMQTLRRAVLDWYYSYAPMEDQFRDLLLHPSTKMHDHKHANSRFFWAHGVGTENGPSEQLNGMHNMHRLLHNQLVYASELYNNTLHLPEIFSEAAHERMHDFRKMMRALLNENDMFVHSPWQDELPIVAQALAHFQKMYDGFGAANDLRNGYLHAMEVGDFEEAMKTAKELDEAWAMLKTMQIDLELLNDIHNLRVHMSPNCTYP